MADLLNTFFVNYTWNIAIIHIIAAIVLFFIVNWIGAHSVSIGYIQLSIMAKEDTAPAFNFLFRALSPIVFLVLFIVVVQSIGHHELVQHSYLIVLYYWLFRTTVVLIIGRKRLTNWGLHLACWIVSLFLSVWIYLLVDKVDKLLPDPRSLLDQMWILIIMFIYSAFNKIELSTKRSAKREKRYIDYQYNKFKTKYGSLISDNCSNEFYEAVTYSIMIYENFNRPKVIRWIEYFCFWITKHPHTLGIMQVMSDKRIDDHVSIIKAIDIIKKAALKYKDEEQTEEETTKTKLYSPLYSTVYHIAGQYNTGDDYENEICEVFESIEDKYKNIGTDYNKI